MTRDSEAMNDTVSEDVKLDADAIKAARKAFCERPGLPLDKQLDMAIRAYLAATKPASPLPGDVTLTYEDQRLLKLMEGTTTAWEHATDTITLTYPKSSAATLRKALALIDRLRASPPMPGRGEGWQDISTAPKDGTMILGAWRFNATAWLRQPICWSGEWVVPWDMTTDFSPTHWHPLPEPPAASRPKEDTHAK